MSMEKLREMERSVLGESAGQQEAGGSRTMGGEEPDYEPTPGEALISFLDDVNMSWDKVLEARKRSGRPGGLRALREAVTSFVKDVELLKDLNDKAK